MTFAIETELGSMFGLVHESATLKLGKITSVYHLPSLALYLLRISCSAKREASRTRLGNSRASQSQGGIANHYQ